MWSVIHAMLTVQNCVSWHFVHNLVHFNTYKLTSEVLRKISRQELLYEIYSQTLVLTYILDFSQQIFMF